MEVFKLFGSILVKTDEAENSISKTEKKAEGLGGKLGKGIKTAAKWGAAITGAAVAVGGAMIKASQNTADTLDVIDKASQRMNVSAESYQELAHAADLSGVSMQTLEKAAKNLVGTDMNFDEALDQIMALGTESERTAMAEELFGKKVAYDMVPLLKSGAEGLAEMRQEANDLGLVMSQETVTSGAELNDMFARVQSSLSTLKTQLMADMMPYVISILEWVVVNVPVIRETVKSVMDAIMPIIKVVFDFIMEALPPIMNAIKKLMDWIMPYVKPVLESIGKLLGAFFKLFQGDTEGFATAIKDVFINLAKAMFGIGEDILTGLWNGLKSVWEKVKNWFSDKVAWIKDKLNVWKDSQLQMAEGNGKAGNGAHAAGLPYVPYDGYKAVLHKGETVLSKSKSQSMVEDIVNALTPMQGGGTYTINVQIDKETIARAVFDPLTRLNLQEGIVNG